MYLNWLAALSLMRNKEIMIVMSRHTVNCTSLDQVTPQQYSSLVLTFLMHSVSYKWLEIYEFLKLMYSPANRVKIRLSLDMVEQKNPSPAWKLLYILPRVGGRGIPVMSSLKASRTTLSIKGQADEHCVWPNCADSPLYTVRWADATIFVILIRFILCM